MQARRSISLLLVSTALALPGVGAQADDAVQTPSAQVGVQPAASLFTLPSAAPAGVPASVPAGMPETSAAATPPASGTTAAAPPKQDEFGVAMTTDQLDEHRGGDVLIGQNYLTGAVANNSATRVETGSNTISEGSFASSSGLPTVIQNTGANVLIQNATVLNVRFGN
ncbi:hypothetical protein [Paraburkholderia sp.]|uniref:hypothetical protein n=1 Tax=Paraburkholderia sp. TaxID=1926495 RepID=UPI0025F3DCDC|nr:hypothetical protein [Paraburkholderia sp.]